MHVKSVADFFKSLSEPVRLRLINLLSAHDELCVCDLVDALALPQSVVSRHLAYLRQQGLLSTRRQGVWIFYKINADTTWQQQVLALYRDFGGESAELAGDLERLGTPNNCCD
ncbi:helix-turn-helix transcriptional regulator [Exilibacterium tricleocarpae]|uniref:Helix-turn-helix transcriptional regulator n=1 Tax=Exilibacterium tricleocarpae TaxID=2591008 RepID=A0A545STJ6_9GAMM|nr:metalloregulator ArsR/SmtB family transcription factor [Exilibacterium tricleocarpae]TQV68282.1 helix-turn-helix transcriptional regulator [Exilibacterium tricleocarpae]